MATKGNPFQTPTEPLAAIRATFQARRINMQPAQPSRSGSSGPARQTASLAFIVGGLFIITATVMALGIGLVILYQSDLILPGVQALHVPLGGKTKTEAITVLEQYWQRQVITLTADKTTWTVQPDMLGLRLDTETTVQRAYAQSRTPETLAQAWTTKEGLSISPLWIMDPTVAEANLRTLAPKFEIPAVDATVQIVAGRAEATPASSGQALDVAATVTKIFQNPEQTLHEGRLALVMVPVEPAISDVSAIVDRANQLLATSLTIRAYDPINDEHVLWTVTPDTWGAWLALDIDPANPAQFNWNLDSVGVETYLSAQAVSLGDQRYLDPPASLTALREAIATGNGEIRLRVYHHPQQHTVRPGETLSSIAYYYGLPYPWIQQANPGVGNALEVGQVLTIPSADELLPLPVVEHKRIVISLSEQKMWAYERGALHWEWPVSTGIASSPTSPGVFQVQTHQPNAYAGNWDLWMPHFLGIYRPVPTSDFMNGFHGFPTRNGNNLLWTGDLGHRVTFGCILVSSDNAAALYDWAEEGVVVEIRP
jgi:LysM repeat protein